MHFVKVILLTCVARKDEFRFARRNPTTFPVGATMEENMKMNYPPKFWGFVACLAGLAQTFSAQASLETISLTDNGVLTATGPVTTLTYDAVQGQDVYGVPAGFPGTGAPAVGATGLTTLDYVTKFPLPGSTSAYPNHGWVAIYSSGTPSSDYGTKTDLLKLIHFDNSFPSGSPPEGISPSSLSDLR